MILPWNTKSDRSIPIIEDRISRLLHHCHKGILWRRWAYRLDAGKVVLPW